MLRSGLIRSAVAIVAAVAGFAAAASTALALSVTVNGQPATFNPPPIQRAGRVFVPLRGVFEKLGASVVYEGGVINATGNGQRISLKIGSTQATVNGQPRTIDVAPFIIGASTYVPLRFVSEALGAGVNYDASNQIVVLTTNGSAPAAAAASTPAAMAAHILHNLSPAVGGTVASTRPTLQGEFSEAVDPNSVHLTLDGRDVTSGTTLSSNGFVYAPPSPLQSIKHTVQVSGKLASGQTFSEPYTFTTGNAPPANTLTLTAPAAGATVPNTFTVSGKTVPNAQIHIVGGATATVGGVFAFGAGNYTGDTTADANGNFSQSVTLQTVSGAAIGLTVTSTDPQTKEAAEKKLHLRAQ